ncbi:hypothetical protein [Streptomyces sp. NPDC050355]|uniref:Secreted protein n=1 Tax=Streptomyces sirii TaxID=3127701 RepID=A0ABZ2QTP4_9ACTN
MKMLKSATVGTLCAAVSLTGLTLAPAAYAGGKGGCYDYSNTHEHNNKIYYWQSCVSKPGRGLLRAYARVWLPAKHDKCEVEFNVLKAGSGSTVYKAAKRPCPKGKVNKYTIKGFDWEPKSAGDYTVVARLRGVGSTHNVIPRSPWIQMP